MNDGFFLIAGFGFLMWFGGNSGTGPGKRSGHVPEFPEFVPESVPIFLQGFELFLGLVFLLSIHGLAAALGLPAAAEKKFFTAVLFLCAYLLKWILKRSDIFSLTLFVFAFVLAEREAPLFLPLRFLEAAFLASAASLFQFLMEGLRCRLLFSPVPKPLAGLPIYFLAAALLSLALNGFVKLFP